MRRLKILLTAAACAALLVTLLGCQKQEEPQRQSEELPRPNERMVVNDKEDASHDPFYVLLVGNDSRQGTPGIAVPEYADGSGRSDTMMLARIDPATYTITLVTIPRDTACTLSFGTAKINEAYHVGGMQLAIEEVEKLTGVSVKYYLNTGFVQFEALVDELGGLTANSPMEFSFKSPVTGDPVQIAEGEQHLDGAAALSLARMRKEYDDYQDAMRQIQDRQLVQVAIEQTASDPSRVPADAATLIANTETNWPTDELLEVISDFASHADQMKFYSGTGPFEGGIDESAGGLWLATRDEATWREIVKVVDAGGDPTTVLPLPSL